MSLILHMVVFCYLSRGFLGWVVGTWLLVALVLEELLFLSGERVYVLRFISPAQSLVQ